MNMGKRMGSGGIVLYRLIYVTLSSLLREDGWCRKVWLKGESEGYVDMAAAGHGCDHLQ